MKQNVNSTLEIYSESVCLWVNNELKLKKGCLKFSLIRVVIHTFRTTVCCIIYRNELFLFVKNKQSVLSV